MRIFLFAVVLFFLIAASVNLQGQGFPSPTSLSTGQGTQGNLDPIWLVSDWFATSPNTLSLTYTPALISNNCAPGAWVNPASLPYPVNNGNWITNVNYPCSTNTNDGYIVYRLPLNLPAACNGLTIASAGNYTLYLTGYSDNDISDVYVNGTSTGYSGGGFSAGSQLNMTLNGPWVSGINYVDVIVYNTPNGSSQNPYGLLLVANTTNGYANGCPPGISGDTVICRGDSTTLWVNESGYTYAWSTGSSTDSIRVAPSANTTYSVTVSNSGGYTAHTSVTVLVNPLPVATISPLAPGICPGGSATLTAGGGSGYTWSTTATTAAVSTSPAITTSYTVTVTDANLCSATASRTVTVYPVPIPVINPSAVQICNGASTTLTASGGTGYAWSIGGNAAPLTVSPTATTIYTVTATNANNCTAATTRTVTVNPLPIAAISPAIVKICIGGNATLTATGGTGYAWSNSANINTTTVSPTTTTIYSVTVTDANACTAATSRSVTVNPLPVATITPAIVKICNGGNATLTAAGGTGYAWSNTSNISSINVSPAITTTYAVTVTDINSCSAATSRTVTVNQLPVAVITPINPVICVGNSVNLTAGGGTGYAWSNTAVTATTSVSPATTTTFSVTVTDINSCTSTTSKSVLVNPLPAPVISPANPAICLGSTTALTASGGTGYTWSTTANTPGISVSPTANTSYTVTVTDANSCTATTSETVTVNPLPIAVISPINPAICLGNSITLTATGGTGFAWSNTANTASISVSPAITTLYSVIVTDVNSCTATTSQTITVNALPVATINPAAPAICSGSSVMLTAAGGTGFAWSNAANSMSINVSPAVTTTYTVTVTDANACSATTSGTVTVNSLPIPIISPANPAICLGNAVSLSVTGGTIYAWSNAANTSTINVSPAVTTTYTVTVTDINTCTATTSQMVTVYPLPTPIISPVNPAICLANSVMLTAAGGTGYSWSNADNTAGINISPAVTTTYTVTVTDINTCTATTSQTVTVNPLPIPVINPAAIQICNGSSAVLTGGGGINYIWSNSVNTQSISVSPATTTTFTITVTDANICSATTSSIVTVNPLPVALINPAVVQICFGSDTTLTATGGLSYVWSSGSNTNTINIHATATASYSVTVTDANSCTKSSTATVTVIPTMILSAKSTEISCYGYSDGAINLTANSGLPPYTYLWNTNAANPNPRGLMAGPYSVTVTDQAGCSATASSTITSPPLLGLTSSFTDPTCSSMPDNGSITLDVTGGTPPYQYLWSNNAAGTALSGAGPGSYTTTVSDANNCTIGSVFSLAYIYDFAIHATPSVTIKLGDSALLGYTISGNSGNIQTIWSNASSLSCISCSTPLATPDFTTLYQVEIKNDSGCTATDTVTVSVIPEHSIYIPNAFTPNGDGNNDVFKIYSHPNAIKFIDIQVFNRWGEEVFRSNDLNFFWDGSYMGTMQEPGIFIWQLKVAFIDGHADEIQKGSLTMIR
jgi:gliding motility-associated-like protein